MKRPLAIIGAAALLVTAAPTANAEDSTLHNTNQGSSTDLNELVVDSPITASLPFQSRSHLSRFRSSVFLSAVCMTPADARRVKEPKPNL